MSGVYVFSDKSTLAGELIAFAKTTSETVNVWAFSPTEAEKLAAFGADRVLLVEDVVEPVESYAKGLAEYLDAEGAVLLLVGATPRGRDLAAQTAGYWDKAMVSDVTSVGWQSGTTVTTRLLYGGVVSQKEAVADAVVVTVPAGKFESRTSGKSEVVKVKIARDERVTLIQRAPVVKEGVDLTVADRIVSIGMGFEKHEDLQIARDLAEAIGAEIGGTRAICEQHNWLPDYIGISGMTVKPTLYVALGISGQVQHLVGMRESKIVVGINKDENAPIFKAADYGVVGDLYEITPLLTTAIKQG